MPYEAIPLKAVQVTKSANALAAQDVEFHASIDRLTREKLDLTGARILELVNEMLHSQGFLHSHVEHASWTSSDTLWKQFVESLDSVYEKIDMAFDVMTSPKRIQEPIALDFRAESAMVLSKPQLHFLQPVDNSDSKPFKPKLKSKPHAIEPLEASLQVFQGQIGTHYPNPYKKEIVQSRYPEAVYKVTPVIPPKGWHDSSAIWVDNKASLLKMIEDLRGSPEIAVDLEHHDLRSYYGLTCLMQISSRQSDWLIDTLALREELESLNIIFADPAVIKVFHGSHMDIIWLQRDLGLYVVSLFDTFLASKSLGLPKLSLAYLLERFANFKTAKRFQLSDWRIRPIPKPMMEYARSDTHFLLSIYDQLRNLLLELNLTKLEDVLTQSRALASKRFEFSKVRDGSEDEFKSIYGDSSSLNSFASKYNIHSEQMTLTKSLFQWRDDIARDLDESPRYIMKSQTLANLASSSSSMNLDLLAQSISKGSSISDEQTKSLLDLIVRVRIESSTSSERKHEPNQDSATMSLTGARACALVFELHLKSRKQANGKLKDRLMSFDSSLLPSLRSEVAVKLHSQTQKYTLIMLEMMGQRWPLLSNEMMTTILSTTKILFRDAEISEDCSVPDQVSHVAENSLQCDEPVQSTTIIKKSERSAKSVSVPVDSGSVFNYEAGKIRVLHDDDDDDDDTKRPSRKRPEPQTRRAGASSTGKRRRTNLGKSTSYLARK